MDQEAMSLIQSKHIQSFRLYLQQTGNTICGRYPILLLLAILNLMEKKDHVRVDWLAYAQSEQVVHVEQSSVSYASASIVFPWST